MLQVGIAAERDWKFEKVEDGWMWEHKTVHGGIIAAGFFVSLAQCIRDARSFGFVEARWERRNVPRTAASHGAESSSRPPGREMKR